jgi:hypothetical protein
MKKQDFQEPLQGQKQEQKARACWLAGHTGHRARVCVRIDRAVSGTSSRSRAYTDFLSPVCPVSHVFKGLDVLLLLLFNVLHVLFLSEIGEKS